MMPRRRIRQHVEFEINWRWAGRGSFKRAGSRENLSEMIFQGRPGWCERGAMRRWEERVFNAEKVASVRPWGRDGLCVFEEKQVGQNCFSRVTEGKVAGDHMGLCRLIVRRLSFPSLLKGSYFRVLTRKLHHLMYIYFLNHFLGQGPDCRRERLEIRNQPRAYFSSPWEEMTVAWVRVISVEIEGNDFRIYFGKWRK